MQIMRRINNNNSRMDTNYTDKCDQVAVAYRTLHTDAKNWQCLTSQDVLISINC